MEKTCIICGKLYQTDEPQSKCCTKTCRMILRKQMQLKWQERRYDDNGRKQKP